MLHDYTNTELPQGQKRYVETSEAVVTLTVSPSHFTFFFGISLLQAATFANAAKYEKKETARHVFHKSVARAVAFA